MSWTYLAAAIIAGALLWTLSDRWWPATLFLFGPRWVLMLPLAVLVPAAVILRASLLLPLGATAAILLFPIMGLRIAWRSWLGGPGTTSAALRVVTLNTGGTDRLLLELPFRLAHWRADIVAMQECTAAMQEAVQDQAGWHSHVEGELCLLSRYPISDANVRTWNDLADAPDDSSDASVITWRDLSAARERGVGGSSEAASYVIEMPQRSIRLVNLHLETPRKGLENGGRLNLQRFADNTALRAEESRRTREWLGKKDDSALLIVGDFNMPVESSIYRRDWSEFRNAFSEAGTGFGMTRDFGWIQARIDHVLAGTAWRVRRAIVGSLAGLDHRPVIVDLSLQRGSATGDAPRHASRTSSPTVTPVNRSPWLNEPAGLKPLTDVTWNRLTNLGWSYYDDGIINLTIESDPSAPRSPSNVYQHRFPKGWPPGFGGAVSRYVLTSDEIFIGMYFMHSSNWEQPRAELSKLFYVFQRLGSDRQATFMALAGPTGGPYTLQISNEPDGGAWWTQNVSNVPIIPGRWHRLELYYKKASVSWAADGVVRWWINGTLAASYTNAKLRGEPFSEFYLNPVWGGTGGPPTTRDISLRYDHIYISGR